MPRRGALVLLAALLGCAQSVGAGGDADAARALIEAGVDAAGADAADASLTDATDASDATGVARDAGTCVGRVPDVQVCEPNGSCLLVGGCQLGICCNGVVDPATCECHCGNHRGGCNGNSGCCIPQWGPYDAAAGYGCYDFAYCRPR